MATFKNWAIVFNPAKTGAAERAQKLAGILKALGATGKLLKSGVKTLAGYDAAATVGGDGTLLSCVGAALTAKIPLVGVNAGHLGYLTGVTAGSIEADFTQILAGKWRPVERMVLKATCPDGSAHYALNDVVVKSAEYRMATLKVSVDGEHVTNCNCDGLIFSTPTGSTAYNLSAGGPILHRELQGLVMTPICAHSLTNRSVVFSSKSRVRVEALEGRVLVSIDGRSTQQACLPVEVRQATRRLLTLENPGRGAFETMREKLGW